MVGIEDFLGRLQGVRRVGEGRWLSLCPGHADTKPSLSVAVVSGRVLLHCHAGCEPDRVLNALGLSFADLRPDSREHQDRKIETTYDYPDKTGRLLFQVVRSKPRSFARRQPDGHGAGDGTCEGSNLASTASLRSLRPGTGAR